MKGIVFQIIHQPNLQNEQQQNKKVHHGFKIKQKNKTTTKKQKLKEIIYITTKNNSPSQIDS